MIKVMKITFKLLQKTIGHVIIYYYFCTRKQGKQTTEKLTLKKAREKRSLKNNIQPSKEKKLRR